MQEKKMLFNSKKTTLILINKNKNLTPYFMVCIFLIKPIILLKINYLEMDDNNKYIKKYKFN